MVQRIVRNAPMGDLPHGKPPKWRKCKLQNEQTEWSLSRCPPNGW